ncbi:MAG: polyhydroxyalkanoic acid system family protein [Pseudomonadota bacterium]
MNQPVDIDIPHKLGRAEAKARMDRGIGKLADYVPGSAVTEHRWDGDTMAFTLEAMGQRVGARMEVFEDKVHAVFDLPPMLAMFAGKVRDQLAKGGQKLLE